MAATNFFAWVGDLNSPMGPVGKNRKRNTLGNVYRFQTKAQRDNFCDKFNNYYNMHPQPTTKRDARKYYQAMGQDEYNQFWDSLEITPVEDKRFKMPSNKEIIEMLNPDFLKKLRDKDTNTLKALSSA